MKNIVILTLVTVTLNSCMAQNNLNNLDFLLGTWKIEQKESYETWEKVSDTQFIGNTYKIENGEKIITETLSIQLLNNKIVYTATVPNQNDGLPISFELNRKVGDKASFENLAHDFPKKIQYQKISDTQNFVNVIGEDGEGFSYTILKQ